MRAAEVARMLDRARVEGGIRELRPEVRRLVQNRATQVSLAQLADSLILARWLSARVAADLGERA
jgi:CRISPR-associated protein Cmr2